MGILIYRSCADLVPPEQAQAVDLLDLAKKLRFPDLAHCASKVTGSKSVMNDTTRWEDRVPNIPRLFEGLLARSIVWTRHDTLV